MGTLDQLLKTLGGLSYVDSALSVQRVVVTLVITFIVGLFIFYIYRKTFKGVLYTRNFNIGLVMTALVTALIIMPISSNVILSLGLVGALSIVRFRTAIKDPIDIVFMFWAIAVGLACGAGFYMVAIVGSPVIGQGVIASGPTHIGKFQFPGGFDIIGSEAVFIGHRMIRVIKQTIHGVHNGFHKNTIDISINISDLSEYIDLYRCIPGENMTGM